MSSCLSGKIINPNVVSYEGDGTSQAACATNIAYKQAIIASGDLSHCLRTDAPVGFRKEGAEFDEAVQASIRQMTASKLISMNEDFIEAAAECAYRPLLILFGMIERMNVRPEILSYEAPFGVGYLTAEFHLK